MPGTLETLQTTFPPFLPSPWDAHVPFQAVHGRWPIVVAPPDGHVSDEAADRHVDTAAGAEEAAFLEQVAQVATASHL